ncbi:MAG: Sporulation kinase A [Pelotomaculum sp. PtaB.Bin104]|nr:MAG: Sporulation kinase A [Pelotomaculum sp. PtaB.Bin104]
MLKYKFSELVDIPNLQKLMEGLYIASGISSGIHDADGNPLVAVGWREICTKFYRVNNETELLCRQSDVYIKRNLQEILHNKETYICYTCANGLIDAAAPIIIDGEHVATIFHGQFLFEEPDKEQFRRQARRYGFNEEEYMKALDTVPIYTRERLDSIMVFFRQLAETLAQMGLAQLRLIESKEKALQESEERLKTIINNTPNVAIQSFNENGNILFSNKASEIIFGWPCNKILGKTLDQSIFNSEITNNILKLLKAADKAGRPIEGVEWTFKNKDGIDKTVYSTVFPIHLTEGKRELICIDIDITEKKRYEKEMYRLEQFNLIGKMAAGIGHEIRNPMTTVRGFLQLLKGKERYTQDQGYINLMIEELDRANTIITEYLSLARNKSVEKKLLSLNEIIESLYPLLSANVTKNNIYIDLELGKTLDLPLDKNEIHQLILNLVRNGIEAMEEGGVLTIRTFQEDGDVVLAVQDRGQGIDAEVLEKLGLPFLTTKDTGTGLGLAICYSIAQRHNAKIDVETGSTGTTFSIRFKVTQ